MEMADQKDLMAFAPERTTDSEARARFAMKQTIGALVLPHLKRVALRFLSMPRWSKQMLALAADIVSIWAVAISAFWLRLGYFEGLSQRVAVVGLFFLFLSPLVFHYFGLYKNIFRFHGTRVIGQLLRACALLAAVGLVAFATFGGPGVPRTIPVIFALLLFFAVSTNRIVARFIFFDLLREVEDRRRVIVYGAGESGRQLAASLHSDPTYRVIAHIDDNAALLGRRIEGVPIFHGERLQEVIKEFSIDIVFLAIQNMPIRKRRSVVEKLAETDVSVLTLPNASDVVSGRLALRDLREIEIADLLAREPVQPNQTLLRSDVSDCCVLITGAGGSIGSELTRIVAGLNPSKLVLFDFSEAALFAVEAEIYPTLAPSVAIAVELGSMLDRAAVERIFEEHSPDTVFHAAAYKHVPILEANPLIGARNNIVGTRNLVETAFESRVESFVLISTDKAVRPTSVMGASKRVCELILQAFAERESHTRFTMVRFGNVLGSSGSVVPLFKKQIAEGGPITITHREMTRYFMTIKEAAELVIQAGSMGSGGEVYLLDMGDAVKIWDLAKSMIHLSGLTERSSDNPEGEIEIVEIGLRPGEKLYEELLIDGTATETEHPRIFRAAETAIAWPELARRLDEIDHSISSRDPHSLRRILGGLVSGQGEGLAEDTPSTV